MGVDAILRYGLLLRRSLRLGPSIKDWSHIVKVNFSTEPKVVCEMNKAYFRRLPDTDTFHIVFNLNCNFVIIKKPICVVRKVTETVDTSLQALDRKLSNLIDKKLENKRLRKKQTLDGDFLRPEINPILLHNNKPLHDVVFETIFNSNQNGEYKLKLLENDYDVIINSPWIESMKVPSEIFAGCLYYPCKFQALCTDKEKSTFLWFKSEKKPKPNDSVSKWIECGSGYAYPIKKEDVGHRLLLRCHPKNEHLTGPALEVISPIVKALPENIPFEKRHTYTESKLGPDEMRIVSYNVLADVYSETKDAKNTLFSYCEPSALSMDYRKHLLLKEILGYNADLICLQEVDSKIFQQDLSVILSEKGFKGEYCEKGGNREGTACFFDFNKFELSKSQNYVLSDELENNDLLKDVCAVVEKNDNLLTRLRRLGTGLQIVVLKSSAKENEIIVLGNTHLYFHPDSDHIRLLQGVLCFKLMQNMSERVANENPGKNVNIIMCGDFNSVPECGIYQLMTKGFIQSDHIDWKSNENEKIEDLSFSHALKFESACGTPKYTNYTVLFKDCLDYIYYQTDRLEVKKVIPFPTEEELSKHSGIPSVVFPSDHVALVVDLKWKC